jgi:hypothetical protein
MSMGRTMGTCVGMAALGFFSACGGGTGNNAGAGPDASGGAPRDAAAEAEAASDAGADGSSPRDAAIAYPAFLPSAPQIQTGGTVLTQPKLVTVSFANDPLEADIDTMVTAIDTTTYWSDRIKEYGSSALKTEGRIHDPTVWPATIDDSQIQAWLLTELGSGGDAGPPDASTADAGAWPPADPNAVYALVFPPGVSITDVNDGLPASCGTASMPSWHGYHNNVTLPDGQNVAYAVISRCDSIPEDPAATGIQYVSAVMSHEVIEAITDPFSEVGKYGYVGQDPAHLAFYFTTSAELGDMCALVGNAFYTPTDFPYLVQRIWSNKVAPTGHDPCLPEPAGQPYFNSVPVLTDTVRVPSILAPGLVASKGVTIGRGQSKTVEVDLFSEAPTPGPWTVRAVETDGSNSLSFSFDKTTGQNGDKLALTITVLNTNALGEGSDAEAFAIVSTLGTQLSFWAGFVGN